MIRTSLLFFFLGLIAVSKAHARTDMAAEDFQKQFLQEFARQTSIEHAQYERVLNYLKTLGYTEENSSLTENPDIYATGCADVSPQCENQAYTYTVVYRQGEQRAVLLSVGGVAIHPRTRKVLLIREQMTKLCFEDACDPMGLNSDIKN